MTHFSLPVLIVSMILIIALQLYIYYRQKGSFKNALALVAIMVLTALFGLLLQESFRRIADIPSSSTTSSYNTDNDTTVFNDRQLEGMRPSNIKSVGDFFYFISPLARKYVRNRDKTFSPDWFLILFSLLASIFSFGSALAESKSSQRQPISNIVKGVFIGLIFSLLDWYVIFYMASMILHDMDGIYGMIMAILVYWFIFLTIFAIESVIEYDLLERIF